MKESRKSRKSKAMAQASLGFLGWRQDATGTPRGLQGRKAKCRRPVLVVGKPQCQPYTGGQGRYQDVYDKLRNRQGNQYTSQLNKLARVSTRIAGYDYNDQRTRTSIKNDTLEILKFMKKHGWAPHWEHRRYIHAAFNNIRKLMDNLDNHNGNTMYNGNNYDDVSCGNVASQLARWYACAIDIVCHVLKVKMALVRVKLDTQAAAERRKLLLEKRQDAGARVIQRHFLEAKYNPDGPLFHKWANQTAAKQAMKA